MRLLSVTESSKPDKKFTAVFDDDGRKKTTHFGAAGMDDYTITKDKTQRALYRQRHAKDLKTNNPTRAGFLSYYILWGDSVSLKKNIDSYVKRFDL